MDYKHDISVRKQILKKLLDVVLRNEQAVIDALFADFRKPPFEAVVTETNYVISDLKDAIKTIRKRARPKRVRPSLLNFPSTDYIYSEPYGKVLIIAPWNYPFQLAMCPLIAAVSAGNSVVLKPSELTPNTSALLSKIISEVFDPEHVTTVEGGPETAQRLLQQRWDYIFFTGSVAVGKAVSKAAAEHLTPVTLELGGKNPCIVDETANLKLAAKRIVWGKFLNAGQTCIAPDFILAHESILEALVHHLKHEIIAAYGNNPELSPDYPRIINRNHFERLRSLLSHGQILHGGDTNPETNFIAPTLIGKPIPESPLLLDEIFGPILPLLPYSTEREFDIISRGEKPLALYVFTEKRSFADRIISRYSFGGGCINDTVIHFTNNRLPFGGVGQSGMGAYHGQSSFDTFSHKKSIVIRGTWLDIPIRYAPYRNKLKTVRALLRRFN